MPPSTIPIADYFFGYLVWIVVAGTIAAAAFRRHRRARKNQRAESLLRGDGVPSAAPLLRTEADRFIHDSVRPLLRSGERSLQQAYVVDRDVDSAGLIGALLARGLFAVLTTERIILLSTRLGVLGPGLKIRAVESIERPMLRGFGLEGNALVLELADGEARRLVIRVDEQALSNQRAFARDVPRYLGSWSNEVPEGASAS